LDRRKEVDLSEEMRWKLEAAGLPLGRVEGGRREYRVRFIQAGRVRGAGNLPGEFEIPAEPLKLALAQGLFDRRASFVDHARWLEHPSLRNLVGVTVDSAWNESGQSVEGVIRMYEGPAATALARVLDGMLEDAAAGDPAPDVGLSLVFWPVWEPRRSGDGPLRLAEIRHVESVDFVFEPAAGGRVIEKLAAGSLRPGLVELNSLDGEKGGSTMSEIVEAQSSETSLENNSASAWMGALALSAAQAMIQASGLPQPSRERLLGEVQAHPERYGAPEDVQSAIETEQAYLARLQENSVVQLGGTPPRSPHIAMGLTGLEQVEAALEALIAGEQPRAGVAPLSGVREAYVLLSGDYEMTGVFHPERVRLAVTSATMPGLVANALNKRVVNLFQEYPRWWEKIVYQEDFSTLQTARWITLGGVGELPTVAEGAAYTELTWADKTETSTFVKKGGYLGITLEAMDKDDTRKLQAAPRALAQAAWLTLSKTISAIFTANAGVGPAMSDGLALFHSTHANLGTTALSLSAYAAARTAMRKQTELNSTERLGALTAPRFLLVPPDLEITALQVLASERIPASPNNDANPFAEGDSFEARMNAARQRVIVVDLWTDTNDWAAVADPRLYPAIGLGFRYGRTPEIFSVASPTAGLMFTNDTLPVKARFFFAAGPMDWCGLFKANVA
jgi:hypothetical protein